MLSKKLEKELEELLSFRANGGGFGDPGAEADHELRIKYLISRIQSRDNLKTAIISVVVSAIVSFATSLVLR